MARTRRPSKSRGAKAEPAAEETPVEIDALLERLEGIVQQLESGDLPLEQALARFEEGMALVRKGRAALDALEGRIELLLEDGTRTPLDPDDPDTDDST